MKKVTQVREKFVQRLSIVKEGTVNVEVFVAEDGKEFEGYMAEQQCAHYEKMCRLWSIIKDCKTVNATWFDNTLPLVYYKAETRDELDAIKAYLIGNNTRASVYTNDGMSDAIPGDWIGYTIVEDNSDNGWDVITFYTLDFVSRHMALYLDEVNKRME